MKFFLIIFFYFLFSSCSAPPEESLDTEEPLIEKISQEEIENKAISDYVATLTMEQKVAQLFLVSIDGTSASISATKYPIPPGGYILFSRNTKDGAQKVILLTGNTQEYYNSLNEIPPYFSIDHEGGLVHRLRNVASPLPSAKTIKNTLPPHLAQELYSYSAIQLVALGIHVNLGPVAEVLYEYNEEFLEYRSFGDFQDVQEYGSAFINGFTQAGIYCVLKHFPGNTNEDPHYRLPVLQGEKSEILDSYVKPFKKLLNNNGLLMSHIIVPAYDEKNPACLSPILVEELVKTELNFNGLIFTDDILMNALSQNGYPQKTAIQLALKAGVNVLMISHPAYWNIIPTVLETLEADATLLPYIDSSVTKIIKEKIYMGLLEYATLESGEIVVQKREIHELYNPEKQFFDFEQARNDGLAMYYQYWTD